MKENLKRNSVFIAFFAVVLVLCAALIGLSVSESNAAFAADAYNETDDVSVGHITDTHYYPLRLCYTDGNAYNTEDENYFYNYIQSKSTKMWLEAEAIFDKSLQAFIEHTPDYIVLSGDVGQDGELISHIDVANKLRKLQNTVRESSGNDKFQIFVVMGNHDLYNEDTFRFDNATGMKETHYYTNRMEAIKIYAGLGYPNMTEEEAREFYAPLSNDLPDGYTFVRSDLSSDFTYSWEFLQEDENGNVRTFAVNNDNRDLVTMAKFLDAGIVKTINNGSFFSADDLCYSYDKKNYYTDIEIGQMTFAAVRNDGKFTCLGLDVVISNARDKHVLGGQLQDSTQEWLAKIQSFARPNGVETLIIGISHHSLLPHWGMEEQITTGFIVYNWVEVSDFLADYGMRYIYTGHMHANDTVSRISFNGNQLTDMESSANVSVGSQIKITRISYGTVGEVYAEKAYLSAFANKVLSVEKLFDKVYKDDKYGYVAANNLNEFLNYNNKTITDYSRYARRRIYDNVVSNYIAEFLRPGITSKLQGIVKNLKIKLGGLTIDLSNFGADVVKLADNLIKEVNEKILADYTYGGETERYKAADMKIFGYAEEMVLGVINGEVAEGTDVLTVFMDCYVRHCTGEDWAEFGDMPAAYQAVIAKVRNGEFVNTLFNALLDRETGLMRIIEGISTTTLDLSAGLSNGFTSILGTLMGVLGIKDFSVSRFNLGEIAKAAGSNKLVTDLIDGLGVQIDLVNMSIPEIIDDIVSKYLTDNFKQSLGEYASLIVTNFGVDGGHIDVLDAVGGGKLITVYSGEEYTYINRRRTEEVTVDNGKLPSMLTTNFGADPATTENFTYFTDRRITDGAIQYTTDLEGKTNATTKKATTKIYGTTKPLIDLGIWCQTGYLEMSRHTVELTGLQPGTTYAYRAGSPSKGYWSDWYTFTTGVTEGAFEALIASDLQSSTQSAYQRIDSIYKDIIAKEFTNGVNFLINPGDVVDNSRNLSQFNWFINSSTDIYASHAMVVAPGNHDEKHFDLEKAGNVEYYGGVSENAVVNNYNYLWSHYNYNLTAEQTQETGFYYSFDYSNVHFTVLNTNDLTTKTNEDGSKTTLLADAQYNWLIKDLTDSDKAYKVVIMHKSLYSEGSHSYDNDVVGMRAQLTPIFAEKGVNLVIGGHDHIYNETYYLDGSGNKVRSNANGKNAISTSGTMYLTMGTLGEKFYKYVDNPNVPTQVGSKLHTDDGKLSDPTYGKLVFDGENLYYYGYQYLREFSQEGTITGGESAEIAKGMDINMIIAICMVGIAVVAVLVAVTVAAIRNKKR